MPSWLITGASRGIGLGIVEKLLSEQENFVIAAARNPSTAKELQALTDKYPKDRLFIVKLDVQSEESVAEAVKEITPLLPNGLDYVINNAGVHIQPMTSFAEINIKELIEEVIFNTTAPIIVTRPLLPLIAKSEKKKIIIITSVLGSIELGGAFVGLSNAYSISKAALNMLGRKWGAELKPSGITVALIHPGWVQTEIGDAISDWMHKYAPDVPHIKPAESAAGVVKVSKDVTLESTTSYWNFDGTNYPW
ncbi:putative short-chain dehydrogenases/reductase [Crucibulum laeve]|uniref:Putative short-chain dehydrogenases/reductase n=1 Tax=Crucibulum laeve TaxID=68775 RepID=A0A5C3LTZ6_9AGAR|nr:putative short-chain dehydrogenases/reductase [Crucibulum laeve]